MEKLFVKSQMTRCIIVDYELSRLQMFLQIFYRSFLFSNYSTFDVVVMFTLS